MSLVEGRVAGQHVEVLDALYVPHPDAFPFAEDDREWMVVVGSVLLFESDVFFGRHDALS